jgi:hypothetical protein
LKGGKVTQIRRPTTSGNKGNKGGKPSGDA